MTIIEWDDVPIVLQAARNNVATLRVSEEGWAQALADAAGSLTQAERDALLDGDAAARSAGDKRLHEHGASSAHPRTPTQTPVTMHLIARLHAAELERAAALENKSALMRASEFALTPQIENAPELLPKSELTHRTEDVTSPTHAVETAQAPAPVHRLSATQEPHARTATHVAHVPHHGAHASSGPHSRHATRVTHAAHAAQVRRFAGYNDVESGPPDEPDDISSERGVSGRPSATSITASAHRKDSTEQVSVQWLDGQQPLRSLRGAAGTGRTAQALLATMRRTSLRDDASPRGLALAGARAGGPWLRRVVHAYVGRDGVTLWVRDAKMNRHGALALMRALHRWADVTGVKIAAVIGNGRMIYRAAHASAADIRGLAASAASTDSM